MGMEYINSISHGASQGSSRLNDSSSLKKDFLNEIIPKKYRGKGKKNFYLERMIN